MRKRESREDASNESGGIVYRLRLLVNRTLVLSHPIAIRSNILRPSMLTLLAVPLVALFVLSTPSAAQVDQPPEATKQDPAEEPQEEETKPRRFHFGSNPSASSARAPAAWERSRSRLGFLTSILNDKDITGESSRIFRSRSTGTQRTLPGFPSTSCGRLGRAGNLSGSFSGGCSWLCERASLEFRAVCRFWILCCRAPCDSHMLF